MKANISSISFQMKFLSMTIQVDQNSPSVQFTALHTVQGGSNF